VKTSARSTFRILADPPGAGRELDAEGVAPEPGGIPIPFEGPGINHLARLLADGGELEERACGLDAGLLLELAAGRSEGILAFVEFAFGDRSGSGAAFSPEETAGVDEEDFKLAGAAAVHQEAGARGLRHGLRILPVDSPASLPVGFA
jgi:hypothetical protein